MKIRVAVFTLALGASTWLQAQTFIPGYVIDHKKDTLKGLLSVGRNKINSKKCSFKKSATDVVQEFTPEDIEAYWLQGDRYYEGRRILQADGHYKKVFAEVLMRGKASLLYDNYDFFFLKDTTVTKIESTVTTLVDGHPTVVKTKRYLGILRGVTADCKSLSISEKLRFDERDLLDVVGKYNECLHSSYHTFKKDIKSSTTSFNVIAGSNFSRFSLIDDNSKEVKSNLSPSPFVGIGIEIFSPRSGSRLGFLAEAWFCKSAMEGERTKPYGIYTEHNLYKVDITYARLPVGLKYYLRASSVFTPYIKFGGSGMFILQSTSTIDDFYTGSTNPAVVRYPFDVLTPVQLTGWGGFGVKKKLKKNSVFAELQYEKGVGLFKRTFYKNSYDNIILSVGISF